MADERILAAIRRFFESKEAVLAAYQAVWQAWSAGFSNPVTITGKSSGEDSANGELVVRPDQFVTYMDALEARMKEYEAEEAGEGATLENVRHTDFGCRFVRT